MKNCMAVDTTDPRPNFPPSIGRLYISLAASICARALGEVYAVFSCDTPLSAPHASFQRLPAWQPKIGNVGPAT